MVKPADAPRLSEWLTATEAAEMLGIARQSLNDMINKGEFRSLHLLGPATRPQYVIRRDEVERMRTTRRFPRSRTRIL